jgi:hypothetical protein
VSQFYRNELYLDYSSHSTYLSFDHPHTATQTEHLPKLQEKGPSTCPTSHEKQSYFYFRECNKKIMTMQSVNAAGRRGSNFLDTTKRVSPVRVNNNILLLSFRAPFNSRRMQILQFHPIWSLLIPCQIYSKAGILQTPNRGAISGSERPVNRYLCKIPAYNMSPTRVTRCRSLLAETIPATSTLLAKVLGATWIMKQYNYYFPITRGVARSNPSPQRQYS